MLERLEGNKYYYIYQISDNNSDAIDDDEENLLLVDDERFKLGNYFKTFEQAVNKLNEIKRVLKNS